MALKKIALAGLGILAASEAVKKITASQVSFKGKVAVITGGSRGLGLVIAEQLAAEGAKVALLARDQGELANAENEISKHGDKVEVLSVTCDVRERGQVEAAIERVVQRFGTIDLLINDAGTIEVGPVENMQLEDFDDALATHLWGPLYTMRATLPYFRKQGSGRIVNIASIGGKIAVPHLLPYSASKFALVGLSNGMQAELAKDNITVTTVNPGLMRTGSPPNAFFKGQHKEEYAWFAISDGMPLISMNSERAARQIIAACKAGQPEITLTLLARTAVVVNALFPGLVARMMMLENRFLPKPADHQEGDRLKTGWESQSEVAPSVLTSLSDQATQENNELHGQSLSE